MIRLYHLPPEWWIWEMGSGFYGESLAKFEAFEKARNAPEFLFAVLNPAGEIAGWYKMVGGCPEWFDR
jgi:hypothetical protein